MKLKTLFLCSLLCSGVAFGADRFFVGASGGYGKSSIAVKANEKATFKPTAGDFSIRGGSYSNLYKLYMEVGYSTPHKITKRYSLSTEEFKASFGSILLGADYTPRFYNLGKLGIGAVLGGGIGLGYMNSKIISNDKVGDFGYNNVSYKKNSIGFAGMAKLGALFNFSHVELELGARFNYGNFSANLKPDKRDIPSELGGGVNDDISLKVNRKSISPYLAVSYSF